MPFFPPPDPVLPVVPNPAMTQKHPREVLWTPRNPRATPMWRFIERVNEKHGLAIQDYEALLKWSAENVAAFWEEVWLFFEIKASRPYDEVSRFPADNPTITAS